MVVLFSEGLGGDLLDSIIQTLAVGADVKRHRASRHSGFATSEHLLNEARSVDARVACQSAPDDSMGTERFPIQDRSVGPLSDAGLLGEHNHNAILRFATMGVGDTGVAIRNAAALV